MFSPGFTLIELLVVIGIVAILAIVVVLTINPVELLRQARDSNRLSDLGTINTALNLYQTDVTAGFMGTSSIVYISIPDTTSTCSNLGLPSLPSGWSYNCQTTSTYRNVNGTGWLPVKFTQISAGAPMGNLPVDPINTTSTSYYTYVSGGSWKLTSRLESQRQISKEGTDGGPDPSIYETGTDTSLAPFLGGLVGWWKFDEGTGGTANDSSGYANNGTWHGTSTTHYVTGKSGTAATFNGSSDYIPITMPMSATNATVMFWVKDQSNPTTVPGYLFRSDANNRTYFGMGPGSTGNVAFTKGNPAVGLTSANITPTQWNHLALVWQLSGGVNYGQSFLNGISLGPSQAFSDMTSGSYIVFGALMTTGGQNASGTIEDARIYNRALSAAEIQAIYNATK